ncbi:unnamed protein product [Medioppia subpectinata]|uniref:Anaphase-promoting complex subunit 1 C-terminal domain-containing protein n=1 Tax=Medioppia subpectinata TaxID=1979941 RepID=A0A7R9LB26_9ACAR|nr:unnamed protein product [Medioppia subpectinata]CAG2117283.1 unnamed protein product [Medioppia subpectinata]
MTFSKYLLSNPSDIELESEMQNKLCSLLFDCASNERLEFLSPLIRLTKVTKQSNSLSLWQIKFVNTCTQRCLSLRSDFIDSIRSLIDKRLKYSIDKNLLLNYLRGTLRLTQITPTLIEAIVFYDMPPFGSFASISDKLSFSELVIELKSKYCVPIPTIHLLHRLYFSSILKL